MLRNKATNSRMGFTRSSQGGKEAIKISRIDSTFGGIKVVATNSRMGFMRSSQGGKEAIKISRIDSTFGG